MGEAQADGRQTVGLLEEISACAIDVTTVFKNYIGITNYIKSDVSACHILIGVSMWSLLNTQSVKHSW